MKLNNWSQFNDVSEFDSEPAPRAKRQRQKQRKWREIEEVKERQRLRRELIEYNVVDMEHQIAMIFS